MIQKILTLSLGVLGFTGFATAQQSNGAAPDIGPVTPVRVNGVLQPGFATTTICKQPDSQCQTAIIHAATKTVLSVDGWWLSACRVGGEPVNDIVPPEADVSCFVRAQPTAMPSISSASAELPAADAVAGDTGPTGEEMTTPDEIVLPPLDESPSWTDSESPEGF